MVLSDPRVDGFDRLIGVLEADGAGGLPLPGLDDPIPSGEYVRLILGEARTRGWSFEEAWASAINRIQPTGPTSDLGLASALAGDRMLLEETRPQWRAAYENRDPTTRERAQCVVNAWHREGRETTRRPEVKAA